jgi:hypothetical protein
MGLGTDIFGYMRNPKPRGVFSSENSRLTFGAKDDAEAAGYLVQSWQISYSQQVQELFEIGSNAMYWAKGRPQGGGSLGRVIGGSSGGNPGKFFPEEAYDICDGGAVMDLTTSGGACTTTGTNVDELLNQELRITMSGCVVTQIGFGMQVADVRLLENFSWRFAYMSVDS